MIKKVGSFLLLFVVLVSCTNKPVYTEIVHEDKFSIQVPRTMKKTRGLNEDAVLQVQNVVDEFYLIVVKENKEEVDQLFRETSPEQEDVFTQFSATTLDYLSSTLDELDPQELKLQEVTVLDLPARTVDFTARIGGLDVYYKFSTFQGKEDYYQVLTWTLKKYRAKNQEQMNHMVNSFKEI